MSQSFSYDLSMSGSPADAQARVHDAVVRRMHDAAKMRLANEDATSLSFRPEWSWPLVAALFRTVGGQEVKLSFGAESGETHVTVSGKVGGDAESIAARDFWTQTLSAN